MTWRVIVHGQTYETDQEGLKQWVREGRVLPTDQVFQPDVGWVTAGQMPELQTLFSPEAMAPPSAGDVPGDGIASYVSSDVPSPEPDLATYGQARGYPPPQMSTKIGDIADLWKRFLAVLVDGFVMMSSGFPGVFILTTVRDSSQVGRMTGGLTIMYLGPVIYWLLCVYLLSKTGASPGKKLVGIVVLRDNGQYLTFGMALLREILKSVLGNLCLVINLWFLFDSERRQLYDKVVRANVYEAS
ncbi:MAG: RDD family protein [Chloracidobacterium sp.]|uniref:RDD family protein n=1 Tax=Chloracidobacterium validum TaxID=2821543 RepID=A0ABX8BE08_9BACT|nr:RDD family protein [Chloracidobacterium validum]QUW03770.1 RDD family protein [Chloracidobacterium validum]